MFCGFNISTLFAQKIDSEAHYNQNSDPENPDTLDAQDDAQFIDERFIYDDGTTPEELREMERKYETRRLDAAAAATAPPGLNNSLGGIGP